MTAPTLLAVLLLGLFAVGSLGHGSLTQPPSRNVVAPINGETWWKDHGNGHGNPVAKPVWGPGVCGDPYQHSGVDNIFLNPRGIQATYSAGQTVTFSWWLQANHGGRIGFKLCPRRDNINQACFDQFPLTRADMAGERFTYIMTGASLGQQSMSASYRLPAGVSCAGGCVLQWEYLTMNSCFEPCNRAACGVYADRRNPITGQSNMGTCCFGTGNGCSFDSIPEVFRNCADIAITGGGAVPPPGNSPCDKCNIPVASGGCKCDSNCNCLPSNPCDKCNIPVASGGCKCDSNCNCLPTTSCTSTAASGGSCGNSVCCASGQCCSQWGWCGTTTSHCGTGCQRSFGTCAAGVASLGTSPARASRRRRAGSRSVPITSTMEPSKFAPVDPDVVDPASAALAERPPLDPTLPVPANASQLLYYSVPSVVTESAALVNPAAAVISPASALVEPAAAAVVDSASAVAVEPAAAAVVDSASAVAVDPAAAAAVDPAAAAVDPAAAAVADPATPGRK